MKIKLRTWLVICFFGISAIFSIAIFVVIYRSLEDNLLERTKDKLNSINILKTKLVENILINKQHDIQRILDYQKSHNPTQQNLIDAISSIKEVQKISLVDCENCKKSFQAKASDDFSYYQFEYNLDSVRLRIYLDYNSIKDILQERTGLGVTGESYLVGSNYRLISESIFFPDSLPQLIPCKTIGAIKAFKGETGIAVYPDYRNIAIIGVYRLINFNGLTMALLTEIDLEEAMSPIKSIRSRMLILLGAILILTLIGATILAEWLHRPVRRLKLMADKLSIGMLPSATSNNEYIEEFSIIIESMNKLIEALRLTVAFADSIGRGKMNEPYESLSNKDELGKAIMTMRDQLVLLNKEKSKLALQSKNFIIEGEENERQRIARDLHDGLGAMLTTLKLKMTQEPKDSEGKEHVRLLDEAIKETRNLAANLMPAVLTDFGIFDALAELAHQTQSNSGKAIKFHYDSEQGKSQLTKSQQILVYRIVQEVINNALKHADCTEIQLSVTEFDDQMNIYIKDNGKGFDYPFKNKNKGLGLKNIQERTKLLNGELIIESDASGTIIEINFPLQ